MAPSELDTPTESAILLCSVYHIACTKQPLAKLMPKYFYHVLALYHVPLSCFLQLTAEHSL